MAGLPAGAPTLDAYRDPSRHDGTRFRYDRTTIAGLPADVYRPCAADAHARLTATAFDDSADRHNISQGRYDPSRATPGDPYSGNVPYRLEGMPVADRLSFYYPSRCFLSTPRTSERAVSEDLRVNRCTVSVTQRRQ